MSDESPPTVSNLTLENFCGFSRFEIELMPLTVLVGPNNGGKTTILRAVKFLVDCLDIALPEYTQHVTTFVQQLSDLRVQRDAELDQLQEQEEEAVAKLEQGAGDIDQRVLEHRSRQIREEFQPAYQNRRANYDSTHATLLQNPPRCTCDVKKVAQRQLVESLETFFFQHSSTRVALLAAELTTTPLPTKVTIRIRRREDGPYLADIALEVQRKPLWQADPQTQDRIFQSLSRLKSDYVQPISNLLPSEPAKAWPDVQSLINQGKPHEVWRNQLHWRSEGTTPEAFQRVIERVRHAMPTVGLTMPGRTRDRDPKVVVQFEEGGVRYDVAESGNGFRTLLSIASCLELSDAPVSLFDEPDSHLHSAIQRELCDFIAASATSERQILLATHAPDMIDQLPLDSQVWIDRTETTGRQCDDTTATLVQLGAIRQSEALEQFPAEALLYFEAKQDKKVLHSLCSRFGDASWLRNCRISDMGGCGDITHLPHVLRVLRDQYKKDVKAAAIRDSDYSWPTQTVGKPRGGVLVCYLPCKEIENLLLLQPQALSKALQEPADRQHSFTGQPMCVPDTAQIAQFIDEITLSAEIKQTVEEHWIVSKLPQRRDVGDLRKVRQEFEQFWSESENRLRFSPGKRVLARLRHRIQSDFKLSLPSLPRLFDHYDPPEDMVQIIHAVRDHLAPAP